MHTIKAIKEILFWLWDAADFEMMAKYRILTIQRRTKED